MFSLTAKSNYGVTGVIELARNYGKGLLQIQDIVQRNGIPKNYLEQLFNRLGKQGILRSVRGNRGGYELAEDPSRITLLRVLEALEGEISMCGTEGPEAVSRIYRRVEEQIRSALDIPLDEVVRLQMKYEKPIIFNI